METDSFIKTEEIYVDIAKYAETDKILQIMNQIDHYLKKKFFLKFINETSITCKANEAAWRTKTYTYLTDDNAEIKQQKAQKSLP